MHVPSVLGARSEYADDRCQAIRARHKGDPLREPWHTGTCRFVRDETCSCVNPIFPRPTPCIRLRYNG